MPITHAATNTLGMNFANPRISVPNMNYNTSSGFIYAGNVYVLPNNSITCSAIDCSLPAIEPTPFDYCRSSGVLSFWDDPKEDIYDFQDGESV